jgi:hypothetical protein
METANFGSARELAQYVTDNTIAQAKIVQVVQVGGRWWLFYYL